MLGIVDQYLKGLVAFLLRLTRHRRHFLATLDRILVEGVELFVTAGIGHISHSGYSLIPDHHIPDATHQAVHKG